MRPKWVTIGRLICNEINIVMAAADIGRRGGKKIEIKCVNWECLRQLLSSVTFEIWRSHECVGRRLAWKVNTRRRHLGRALQQSRPENQRRRIQFTGVVQRRRR